MTRARPENAVQKAIVDYVRAVAPQCLIFAVPNAARRTEHGNASNAVPGFVAGMTDLVLLTPGGRAAAIEVKAGRGRRSAAQDAIATLLTNMGVPYLLARSHDDVRPLLAEMGVRTREAGGPA